MPDPQSFARTAFIEAPARAGVRIDAPRTGPNRLRGLPARQRYPRSTRLAQWTSPPISEYAQVVLKTSYNRGADLMACLVGTRIGIRDCDRRLARSSAIARRLGIPADGFFDFDGAGSDDRNRRSPDALNALNAVAAAQPWSARYRSALPVLGVRGGGSLAGLGTDSPAKGRLHARTGTRAGLAPGSGIGMLNARGISGYLTTAGGRELLVTIIVKQRTPERLLLGFRGGESRHRERRGRSLHRSLSIH